MIGTKDGKCAAKKNNDNVLLDGFPIFDKRGRFIAEGC